MVFIACCDTVRKKRKHGRAGDKEGEEISARPGFRKPRSEYRDLPVRGEGELLFLAAIADDFFVRLLEVCPFESLPLGKKTIESLSKNRAVSTGAAIYPLFLWITLLKSYERTRGMKGRPYDSIELPKK